MGPPEGPEGLLEGSVRLPERPEGFLEGSEGLPEGPEGLTGVGERTDRWTYRHNFSPFYRTLSTVAAAAQKAAKSTILCSLPLICGNLLG